MLGLLLVFSGFVLAMGALVLMMMLRSARARASGPLQEYLSESAGLTLFWALIFQVAGFLAPQIPLDPAWFFVTIFLFLIPAALVLRAWTFEAPLDVHSSRPSVMSQSRPTPAARPAAKPEPMGRTPIADEWQEKIMAVMDSQSGGLSLVEIGQRLGVDWRQLTAAARQLVQDGRLHKKGKRYFKIE
jgi:hypothetical protein